MDVWTMKASEAAECLEPTVIAQGINSYDEVSVNTIHIGLSIARSLKRIADVLDAGGLSSDLHHSITNTAWEAGQNFQRGMNLEK